MQNQSTPKAQAHARQLRLAMTDSERKLWSRLRGNQLGVKFRRQHPVGPYVVDFACLAPALVVELDGSQHADRHDEDTRREDCLRTRGFAVLRFPTDAPLRNLEGVLTAILDKLSHP